MKTIIERIRNRQKTTPSEIVDQEVDDEIVEEPLHPLFKKISEERWYPRDNNPITLDAIIDAILAKLPNASKNMLKTLAGHLIQLNR